MATHREQRGFHVDTVARGLRHTLLNEFLALPVAAVVTWLSHPSSAAYLRRLLDLAATYKIDLSRLNLTQVARAALYLGGTGLLLTANRLLNKWSSNNWAPRRRGEWEDWGREIVVVTGGSSGIGASVVQGLLRRNPRTRIAIIDFAPLSWTPPTGVLGANLRYFQADLSKPDALRAVCARVRRELGHPTVLVNNAGLARGYGLLDGTYADVEITLKTNLTAPFLLVKEFVPDMVKHDHGHVFNVCSMSAIMPPPDIVDYAASKAGIQALHEGLAMELRSRYKAPHVRVTNGVFNFIRTPLLGGKPSHPQFLAPLLHVDTAGEAIVNALYSGYGGVIYLPGIMRYISMVRAAPEWLFQFAIKSATARLAVGFKGRQKVDEMGGLVSPTKEREAREPRELREPREAKEPREQRESRETREPREQRESRRQSSRESRRHSRTSRH